MSDVSTSPQERFYEKFPTWMLASTVKCKGVTDLFYPSKEEDDCPAEANTKVKQARAICNGLDGRAPCVHRQQCLEYAINNGERFGVWGGTSERERRRIRVARAKTKNIYIYSSEDIHFPSPPIMVRQRILYVKRHVMEAS